MKKEIKEHKNKIFTKPFIIAIILSVIFISLPAAIIVENLMTKEQQIGDFEEKWNSDKRLVDDRLSENYPIMFIVSPMLANEIQTANVMALYNDGTYISEVFTYESYDSFQEELISEKSFWEQLCQGYSDYKGSDWSHISTTDEEPDNIRETYLKQYQISDFALTKQVNMALNNQNTFFLFGVTYDENIEPKTHMYYNQSQNSTSMLASEEGQDLLIKITDLLIQDSSNSLVQQVL